MIDLSFFKEINWGNVPQWLTCISTIFVAIFINNTTNKLKKYEIKKEHNLKFQKEIINIIKFFSFIKRSIDINLEENDVTNKNIDHYLHLLKEERKNIPMWMANEEGSFLLIESNLKILRKIPLKERQKHLTTITFLIIGCMDALIKNKNEYAEQFDSLNSFN